MRAELPPLAWAASALCVGVFAGFSYPNMRAHLLAAVLVIALGASFWLNRARLFIALAALFISAGILLSWYSPTGAEGRDRPSTHDNAYYKLIKANVRRHLDGENAALLLAIVYGDSKDMPDRLATDFKKAGLLHLFAASGFNVSLTAVFLLGLARLIKAPQIPAALFGLAGILFYAWLVGPAPSVVRATIMALVLYASILFGRRADAAASTAAAALVSLAWRPSWLFDIGWQLSFACMFGLLYLGPILIESFREESRSYVAPIAYSIGAQAAALPLLLWYFGEFSAVAPAANPLAGLAVYIITVGGFSLTIFGLAVPAGGFMLRILVAPMNFLKTAVSVFSSLPWSTTYLEPAPIAALLLIPALLIALVYLRRRENRLKAAAMVMALFFIQGVAFAYDLAAARRPRELTIAFLDVGHGDATIIRGKDGENILVDGGPNFRRLDPELRRRGVRRLDLLILSHPHSDHLGALPELLSRYPVGTILEPGFDHKTKIQKEFRRAARTNGVPVRPVRAGQVFRVGRIQVDILWPRRNFIRGTEEDVNNNSVVAMIRQRDFSLMMPGDVQEEAIAEVVKGRARLNADILKVSHQGSHNGTTIGWLKKVDPEHAVIFIDKRNPYGHPHQLTLRKLKRFSQKTWRTDRNGDITVRTDGFRYEVTAEK